MSVALPLKKQGLLRHDILLIVIMGTLAACGILYEYLMAHYASRVLGSMESTIYSMIGLMIVAMGLGAFLAKWIRCPYNGFVVLECLIGFTGVLSVVLIALTFSLAYTLPQFLQDIYGLHPTITTDGHWIRAITTFARILPFLAGGLLGLMIGMEIPLIARVREDVHGRHLTHNLGTMYGADYIGAGLGAAVWVFFCLKLPVMIAAVGTAFVNVLIGLAFLFVYRAQLKSFAKILIAHGVLLALIGWLALGGVEWMEGMQGALFKDQVVYTKRTPYQHLTFTERRPGKGRPLITSLYINGRLQFAGNDEAIYHAYLTALPLTASARTDNVLIIGGGDGLALRDVLEWQPETVTLIDLDAAMLALFKGDDPSAPQALTERLLAMNNRAFHDDRVNIIAGDAFIEIDKLLMAGEVFDTIIVDLPDPSHPDINKVYSDFFYVRLRELLAGDGAIGIQSTSPYHTREAFIAIGKTLAHAGFITEQYHTNVPTFGEWGWSIGTKTARSASSRIADATRLPAGDYALSKKQMLAAFVFPPGFYRNRDKILVNTLGSHKLYRYHETAWRTHEGIFYADRYNAVESGK